MKWKNKIDIKTKLYKLRNFNKVLGSTKLRQMYLALVEPLIIDGKIGWNGAFDNACFKCVKT